MWHEAVRSWLVARAVFAIGFVTASLAVDHLAPDRRMRLDRGLYAWDGDWYRAIAELGYGGADRRAVRFFPLFPLLGRIAGWPLLDHPGIALVLIAGGSSLLAGYLIQPLARELGLRSEVEQLAPWILALFPGAFVLSMAYAEGLWLLLATGTLLALRRRQWWWVAGLGAAAALTRPLGVLLVVAVGVEALSGFGAAARDERLRRTAAVAGPLVGFAAYLAYCATLPGGWRAPFTVQDELRGGFAEPVTRTLSAIRDLVSGGSTFTDGLHAISAVALIVLVVACWWLLPRSFAAYATTAALVTLAAENLNSLERYVLNIVPLVLVASVLVVRTRTSRAALLLLATASVGLTTLAFVGSYVP